jgi:hypothetical protein
VGAAVAILDAASMAAASVVCMLLYRAARHFAKDIDDATVEVADFTVIVKGLPETTPIDVRLMQRHCSGAP